MTEPDSIAADHRAADAMTPAPGGPRGPGVHAVPGAASSAFHRGSYGKILLEVALIAIGVFLALWVDQWRERAAHHELAEATLRRFRTEFTANRKAVAGVLDKHASSLDHIRTYFGADPATRSNMKYPFMATNPAFMEYTAWDLALATQALNYIDPDLAQTVAHVYAVQRQLDSATHDITLVMYSRGGDSDPIPLTRSLSLYFGDCTLIEPRLLTIYDDALAKLDARLGPAK
jgi:hypothetical protein